MQKFIKFQNLINPKTFQILISYTRNIHTQSTRNIPFAKFLISMSRAMLMMLLNLNRSTFPPCDVLSHLYPHLDEIS
jgi:hypothetical protein